MKYDIGAANARQSQLLQDLDDDDSWRSCAQCGGNDGYLYNTSITGEWLCKSCHDDLKLEEYRLWTREGFDS